MKSNLKQITINTIFKFFGLSTITRSELIFVGICITACIIMFYIPTGFEEAGIQNSLFTLPVKAEVAEVDNSGIHTIGLIRTGEQSLVIEVLNGELKGKRFDTVNHFLGKLDLDKFYSVGDIVFAVVQGESDSNMTQVQIVDRYRIEIEFILTALFIFFLLIYAGWVGFKSLISFFFTALVIWKILLPGYLKFYPPILFSLSITTLLTGTIIFLIAGFTKKGWTAFLGAFAGVILTALLSILFGKYFAIPGEIKPFSETLLYTGFLKLNLSDIFLSGIFLASSGAVMDIAMDVSASMAEVKSQKPEIGFIDLTSAGFSVGRAVIGTMTTTLLLAYSGGYSTLLMVFIAQGVPIANILNIQYVSAEILHTVVGSFGLISVAPFTAIIGGIILTRR
ncbi:MAG: YibE/F family protein [Desulfamplus sp.]|nr:YibE/F family protein [Desulfamplus sp.]